MVVATTDEPPRSSNPIQFLFLFFFFNYLFIYIHIFIYLFIISDKCCDFICSYIHLRCVSNYVCIMFKGQGKSNNLLELVA
jgi:hypothetical protein